MEHPICTADVLILKYPEGMFVIFEGLNMSVLGRCRDPIMLKMIIADAGNVVDERLVHEVPQQTTAGIELYSTLSFEFLASFVPSRKTVGRKACGLVTRRLAKAD